MDASLPVLCAVLLCGGYRIIVPCRLYRRPVYSAQPARGAHYDRDSGNYRTADRGVTCGSRVCTFGLSRPAWKTSMCRTNHHRPSDSQQRARTPRRHLPSSATALPYRCCRETVTFAARVITVSVLCGYGVVTVWVLCGYSEGIVWVRCGLLTNIIKAV